MRVVTLSHDYPYPPEMVWNIATDFAALEEVMKGRIAFSGLPEGRTRTGQIIDVGVSLFGVLPEQPYRMEVLECDDEAMVLRSSELGAGVKKWDHTLTVTPLENGARLSDRIEIEAGHLTPLFAAWAKYVYKSRHAPRLRLLAGNAILAKETLEMDR